MLTSGLLGGWALDWEQLVMEVEDASWLGLFFFERGSVFGQTL